MMMAAKSKSKQTQTTAASAAVSASLKTTLTSWAVLRVSASCNASRVLQTAIATSATEAMVVRSRLKRTPTTAADVAFNADHSISPAPNAKTACVSANVTQTSLIAMVTSTVPTQMDASPTSTVLSLAVAVMYSATVQTPSPVVGISSAK